MLEYIIKIGLALLLGGIIGYERESNHKKVGLRTSILVTLSGTIVMIFTDLMLGRGSAMDAIRAPSYILTSIGFLGGGIIMSKGSKVEGVTTAALLLVLMPLGLIIGIGEFSLATVLTLAIFFVLKLKYIEKTLKLKREKFKKKRKANK